MMKTFLSLLITAVTATYSANQTAEDVLISNLLKTYNKNVRPSEQVVVNVSIAVKHLIGIEQATQVMTTSNYFAQTWIDPRLVWNESAYNGVQVMMLPAKNIWIPDTMILNTADSDGYFKISEYNLASVHSSGEVYLILPSILTRTRCDLNTRLYPFDTQTCSIVLSSWSHASNRVHYNVDDEYSIDLSEYVENTIWNLTKSTILHRSNADRIPFESTENREIVVEFTLARRPLYYMINGVVPCLILNLVTLLAFMFPYAQQISLSMTIFLTYSVYALRLSSDLPIQSEFVPLITLYFLISILNTLLSMLWFYACNSLMTSGRMPKWLLRVCELIRNLFEFRYCQRAKVEQQSAAETSDEQTTNIKTTTTILVKPAKNEKCRKCDQCNKCEEKEMEAKEKANLKKEYELKVEALNNFVFILFVLVMFISVLSIWIAI